MPMRKAMLHHQNPIYLDKLQIPPCFAQIKFIYLYVQLIWLCLSVVGWVWWFGFLGSVLGGFWWDFLFGCLDFLPL